MIIQVAVLPLAATPGTPRSTSLWITNRDCSTGHHAPTSDGSRMQSPEPLHQRGHNQQRAPGTPHPALRSGLRRSHAQNHAIERRSVGEALVNGPEQPPAREVARIVSHRLDLL